MTRCAECEAEFNVSEARAQYQSEPGVAEGEYDDLHGGQWCADCAIDRAEDLGNHGNAILMMNGDVDYDDDHVEKYL